MFVVLWGVVSAVVLPIACVGARRATWTTLRQEAGVAEGQIVVAVMFPVAFTVRRMVVWRAMLVVEWPVVVVMVWRARATHARVACLCPVADFMGMCGHRLGCGGPGGMFNGDGVIGGR